MHQQDTQARPPALTKIGAFPQRLLLRFVVGRAFHRYFTVVRASSEELKSIAFGIRYDVYCRELEWEDGTRFHSEIETDEYDADSEHVLLLHRPSDTYAGCVRLVRASRLDPRKPLPFELSCAESLYPDARDILDNDRASVGEISRLAVTARFRRRAGETAPLGGSAREAGESGSNDQRRTPNVALGLYLAAACVGLEAGLRGVFALMEPRLCHRLKRHGIVFRKMGDEISHRGTRAPFYIDKAALFQGLDPKLQALLDVIRKDLRQKPASDPGR